MVTDTSRGSFLGVPIASKASYNYLGVVGL